MADRTGCDVGSARRRRERRLRSWLRHERITVAAELSAALHHSRDRGRVKHVSLRAQKTDSAGGMRPAPLAGPQGAAATVGHVATVLPLLVALRGDDGVDGTTSSYLRKVALAKKKKEKEEKERRRMQEEAEHERRMLVLDRRVNANDQLTPAESNAWRDWAGEEEEEEEEEEAAQIFLSDLLGPRSSHLEICHERRFGGGGGGGQALTPSQTVLRSMFWEGQSAHR